MNDPAIRVVSLAPSATATVTAMGAGDAVVGVTAYCDHDDAEILGGWLNADPDRVAALDPDVVLTNDALQRDLREDLRDCGLDVHHREPRTLEDVFESMAAVGDAIGRPDAGERLARECEERVERVRDAVAGRDRPVVYCEEWSDPPMAAGNWVPEAVAAAGGRYPFVDPGDRSREVDDGEVPLADPDYVVLHVCGAGDRSDPAVVDERDWDLDAAVHTFDDDLLNQPSPRLVDGVEALAGELHGVDLG
ncbi:cobalamin-binding protein [Halorarum halophilum]|uniref:Cobalamin-binding protein n=1 Tax=Halorarum halophilum TaxID=2743090 RepID=A0A7D5GIK9_9EURY|nr:cobalamin-binding protein [Halobaculum halophilum]QLG26224.1 cobalamin-binding protein [Halobaculum halophilum]